MEDNGKKWYQGLDLKTIGSAALGAFVATSIMNYCTRNAEYAEIERGLEKARTGIENVISERNDIIEQLLEKRPELADRIKFDKELGTYTLSPDSGVERRVNDNTGISVSLSGFHNFYNNADSGDYWCEFKDGQVYVIDPNLGKGSTVDNPVPSDNPIVHCERKVYDGPHIF